MPRIRRIIARAARFSASSKGLNLRRPIVMVHILPPPKAAAQPPPLRGGELSLPTQEQAKLMTYDPKYNKAVMFIVAGLILALAAYLGLDLAIVIESIGRLIGAYE